ncbi:MAG: UPF0175 family protein [Blastocatellia bacterium]|nr:UPF0175 family protein [Blastocatellia bacterium]
MNAVELKLELPSNLTKDEVQTLLAVKLFETERVSLGQAAKLAGFSKRAFMELLGRQQIPVVNYLPDELREELSLRKIGSRHKFERALAKVKDVEPSEEDRL